MPTPANLVHETSTTTGTGNLTLSSENGKQTFNGAFGTGGTDVFDYFVSNRSASEWERGTGHMSDATTLVRDTVLESTNSNAAVSFSAGTKDVTNDVPAGSQVTTEGEVAITSYLDFTERTDPSNPSANNMRAYARDDGASSTEMVLLDSAGNEHVIPRRKRYETAQSLSSNSSVTFSGIPSWVNRIEVWFDQISVTGDSVFTLVTIGDSGGEETSGYESASGLAGDSRGQGSTAGFILAPDFGGHEATGCMVLHRFSEGGNLWIASHALGSAPAGEEGPAGGGRKELSANLDRVIVKTSTGANFDNGQVNIVMIE